MNDNWLLAGIALVFIGFAIVLLSSDICAKKYEPQGFGLYTIWYIDKDNVYWLYTNYFNKESEITRVYKMDKPYPKLMMEFKGRVSIPSDMLVYYNLKQIDTHAPDSFNPHKQGNKDAPD